MAATARTAATAHGETPIQMSDIHAKLNQINDEVRGTTGSAKPMGIAAGAVVLVAVVAVVYLLGRRRGHRNSTMVEIRRMS